MTQASHVAGLNTTYFTLATAGRSPAAHRVEPQAKCDGGGHRIAEVTFRFAQRTLLPEYPPLLQPPLLQAVAQLAQGHAQAACCFTAVPARFVEGAENAFALERVVARG